MDNDKIKQLSVSDLILLHDHCRKQIERASNPYHSNSELYATTFEVYKLLDAEIQNRIKNILGL